MPEFTLDVDQETYEKSGSKWIEFNPNDKVGTLYYRDIEMDVPDWDNVGISLKFPIRIIGKDENDPDGGKEDKLSAGVAANAIWKLKDTLKALGVDVKMQKGADGKKHPVFNSDEVAGKKAVGCWELEIGNKGGDASQGQVKYPKLVSIYPANYNPTVKELV